MPRVNGSLSFGGTRVALRVYCTEQNRRVKSFFLTDEWLLWVRLTLYPACFVLSGVKEPADEGPEVGAA